MGGAPCGEAADLVFAVDELPRRAVDVRRTSQLRADEKRIGAGAELAHRLIVADARLRDDNFAFWDVLCEARCAAQIDGEVVEVAVVDADDVDAERDRAVDLLLRDGFRKYIEAELVSERLELRVGLVIHDGHHEQDGVRAKVAGRVDLDGVDDEVLAQHRQVRGECHRLQVVIVAAKALRLAEHRDGGRVPRIDARDGTGLVVLANKAQRWGRGLALHDEAVRPIERVVERTLGTRQALEVHAREALADGGQVRAAGRDDTLED